MVEISSTDGLAEVILPPNVEDSPEILTLLVEPSSKDSDDTGIECPSYFQCIYLPETQVLGEAELVSITAAAS